MGKQLKYKRPKESRGCKCTRVYWAGRFALLTAQWAEFIRDNIGEVAS